LSLELTLNKTYLSGPFGIVYKCKAKGQKNELSVKVIPKNVISLSVYLNDAIYSILKMVI
jgi:hypothetical protein